MAKINIEKAHYGLAELQEQTLFDAILLAMANADHNLVKSLLNKKLNRSALQELFASRVDNNNIFHHLLAPVPWYATTTKQRIAKKMTADLLIDIFINYQSGQGTTASTSTHQGKDSKLRASGKPVTSSRAKATRSNPLDSTNYNLGLSPLHLAIIKGSTEIVQKMLEAGASITAKTTDGLTPLELAAEHKQNDIYKMLLKQHTALNKELDYSNSYKLEDLFKAKEKYQANLRKKQLWLGVFGSIMSIACPVGAMLAFSDLPLLGILFGSLLPVAGPFIGLGGAIVLGALLFTSMYRKSSYKYGKQAQQMVELEYTHACLDRLEAEYKKVRAGLQNNLRDKQQLLARKMVLLEQIQARYEQVREVEVPAFDKIEDLATNKDRAMTYALTAGSFLCAFSGIVGLLGGASAFIPAVAASTAVLAGVPVVGWAALGVALVVGVLVAIWAYNAKFQPALEQCAKQRLNRCQRKAALFARGEKFYEELKAEKNPESGKTSTMLSNFNEVAGNSSLISSPDPGPSSGHPTQSFGIDSFRPILAPGLKHKGVLRSPSLPHFPQHFNEPIAVYN